MMAVVKAVAIAPQALSLATLSVIVVSRPQAQVSGTTSGSVRTLRYDQVHFGVSDPAKAAGWHAALLGGKPLVDGPGGDPRLIMGGTRLIFLKNGAAQPSAGSVIDHIAFS